MSQLEELAVSLGHPPDYFIKIIQDLGIMGGLKRPDTNYKQVKARLKKGGLRRKK